MAQEYESHPLALLFPMMTDTELADLAEDIKTKGQLEPIALYDDKILDGRNRYRACRLVGVEPQVTVLEKLESPIEYVISKNLHRRHLTQSQRAAVGAEIKLMLPREDARKRMRQGGEHGGELAGRGRPKGDRGVETFPQPYEPNGSNELYARTRDIVGNALVVSGRTVDKAIAVKKADPEKFEAIKRGEVTVSVAYRQVKKGDMTASASPKQQDKSEEAAPDEETPPSKRQQILAVGAKKKMIKVLSEINGLCRAVPDFNIPFIQLTCTGEELVGWSEMAWDCANKLRVFSRQVKEKK